MDLELPPDFKELLESLNANGVRYMVVGGYAVGFHGYGRSTNDIDIFVANDQTNAERLVKALTEFGFSGNNLSPDIFMRKDSLVIMGVEPLAVDILNYLTGVNFDAAFERRELVDCEDIRISLIGFDDLITNKRTAGRHKDLADVEYLELIKTKG